MCKYCELTTISEREFRNEMNLNSIMTIKDGSQIFELYLNRYISESDRIRRALLIMYLGVKLDDGYYSVKTKELKIKYCPFCGEKLV